MTMNDNTNDAPLRINVQRPSISTSHSWPRLPALALTASSPQDPPQGFNEEEEDDYNNNNNANGLLQPVGFGRHPLSRPAYNDDDDDDDDDDRFSMASSQDIRTVDGDSDSDDAKDADDDDDEKQHYERPSAVSTNTQSADTLVEAAMVQAQAKDRHVKFQDHVAASAALVQQMLGKSSGGGPSNSPDSAATHEEIGYSTSTQHQQQPSVDRVNSNTSHGSGGSHPRRPSFFFQQHRNDIADSTDDLHLNVGGGGLSLTQGGDMTAAASGSVLASLMKLDAQRRQRHDEYLLSKEKKKKKPSKKEKKAKKKSSKKPTRPVSGRSTSALDLRMLDDKLTSASYNDDSEDTDDAKKPTRPKMNRPVSWLSTMSTSHHVVPRLDKLNKTKPATLSRRSSLDSMCTTASQFEPITLEDRVRITFEIANILQKQDFLKKLAKALMLYGCPAHRLEHAMRQVSRTLGVDAEYIYLPNVMLMSFFDATTHTTETHFIRQTQAFDMDKLSEIYRLEKLVSHGEVSVDEALAFIDQVSTKPPLYPVWLNPWIYALCSFSGCVMFFGGRWKEGGVAAALAMVFAGYEVISGRIQSFQPIWEITVCIIIGVVSQGLIKYDFCFTPVAFSAFIVVLPGYGMAIAIQELVSRQLVSGVVRMVYAIIYSFLLGYGVSMGSELYQTGDTTPYTASDHCKTATSSTMPMASESQWFNFLTVPLFALGYCLYVRAKPHRWPTMTFVAACGFVVNYSLNRWAHAPSQILQVVPSFVLGMLGNLLTKFTGKMSFDAVLLGIFYQLPSSLGVKAALGLFGNTSSEVGTQGAGFALAMIESSIGITVGLFLATLIVYPRGTQHTPLMTF